ncbi:MAG: hypothetical protein FJ086_00730 [Deltaproteobacteria bacterium]|nr:hypothetical protein [Deltaproteobacteria bacterium]
MNLLRVASLLVLSLSTLAAAQPRRTLARVVSVEGRTVTLEVLEGYLTVGDEVERWSEAGKRLARPVLPVDLLNKGDRVAGISLPGAVPPAGALLAQCGQFASWREAEAALATFPPRALARILAAEGGTVTVHVVLGNMGNGDALDLFSRSGKAPVTVKLPSDIGFLGRGDAAKGVTVMGAAAPAGAVLADKGRFATFTAASAAAGEETTPVAAEAAPVPADGPRDSPAACLFSGAELRQALGFPVGAGRGTELAFSGGSSQSCTWREEKGLRSVVLNHVVMTTGAPATNREQLRKHLAGRLEPIAGDPDAAVWQVDHWDVTGVTLHYARGNTFTEVRARGVDLKNSAAVSAMRRALLSLRRL